MMNRRIDRRLMNNDNEMKETRFFEGIRSAYLFQVKKVMGTEVLGENPSNRHICQLGYRITKT